MRTYPVSFGGKCGALVAMMAVSAWADPTTRPAEPPATVSVQKGDLSLTVNADGWFEPVDAVEIRFRPRAFSGELKVEAIAAHGSAVKAGETILGLNTEEINRQIAAAENELAVAAANLAKAEADVRLGAEADALAAKIQQESNAAADEAVAWWDKADGPNMQKQYEMQLRSSKHNVEDQEDELDQLKKMYKSEELTNQTADIVVKRAVRQLEFSQIALGMTEKRLEKQKATEYEQSRRAVLNAREQQKQAAAALVAAQAQSLVQRQTGLVTARAAHESAYRKLNDLRTDASAMTMTAAADGIVVYGKLVNGAWQGATPDALDAGDKVAPDQVVATVLQPGRVRFVAAIPETQVARVRAGDSVTITPKATPEKTIKGTCGTPSLVATMPGDPAKFSVPVDLQPADVTLMPGYRADAEVDVADASGVLVLPASAVSNGNVMAVDAGGKHTRKAVTVGRSDGDMVEIARGLNEGDKVLQTFKEE